MSDVLFHFDTIVTELEKSTLTPRSVTPIDPLTRTPTPNQSRARELTTPDILPQAASGSSEERAKGVGVGGGGGGEGEGKKGEVVKELPPKSVQPKFKVHDIKQQFLQNAQRDSSACLVPRPQDMTPSSREKVKSIIAQIQSSSSSRETSPSPSAEHDKRETSPVKQGRQRSSSISQRISMLTQVSTTETEVFEKKEQPVVPSRKISEITHDFELKKQSKEERPKTAPIRQRRRSSSASKSSRGDDAPIILSPPKSSNKRLVLSQENGVPPAVKRSRSRDAPQLMGKYTSQEIEEALEQIAPVSTIPTTEALPTVVAQTEDSRINENPEEPSDIVSAAVAPATSSLPVEATNHEEISTKPEVVPAEVQNNDDIIANSTLPTTSLSAPTKSLSAPTVRSKPVETEASTGEAQKSVSVSSPASEGVVFRTESTSSADVLLSPAAVEEPYRFRSVSDVSHHTRKLSSFHTEGSLSSGSLLDLEGDTKVSSTV